MDNTGQFLEDVGQDMIQAAERCWQVLRSRLPAER
jgi:hypothetical protein